MRLSKQAVHNWDAYFRGGRNQLTRNQFDITLPFTEDNALAIDLTTL